MKNRFLLLFLIFPLAKGLADCSSMLVPTIPDNQFLVSEPGLVTDTRSGLMWMRCSLGQQWTGSGCDGLASEQVWTSAVILAAQTNFASFSDWRLPSKNELNSIIETACTNPSTNKNMFPATVSNAYWTSSPYDDESKHIWIINFYNGNVFPQTANNTANVRLVRNIEN